MVGSVRLASPTCNIYVAQGVMGVQGVKIKVSAKTSRRKIYPCSLVFAETVIFLVSLSPKNKTTDYKDQLFWAKSRVDMPSWELCIYVDFWFYSKP